MFVTKLQRRRPPGKVAFFAKTMGRRNRSLWATFGIPFDKEGAKTKYCKCMLCKQHVCAVLRSIKHHLSACPKRSRSIGQLSASNTSPDSPSNIPSPDFQLPSPPHPTGRTGLQLPSGRVVSSQHENDGEQISKRRKKGNSSFRRFVRKDGVTKDEAEKLDKQFARSILRSSMSFSAFDSDDWYKFFYLIRPSWKPPSATQISGDLLDNEYKAVMSESRQKMLQWTSMTITIDGATHVTGKNVMNAILCGPMPFFIEHLELNIRKASAEHLHEKLTDFHDRLERYLDTSVSTMVIAKQLWLFLDRKPL